MKLAIALLSASLMVPVLSDAASAQGRYSEARPMSYEDCVRQQRNRQVAGALIGGILGAVVGAEIHDDRQDRARERHYDRHRHYRGHRGWRDRRGYRGRGYRHHHRHYHEDGNDGAVVAGGAVGAIAGAAIAGQGGCERYFRLGSSHDPHRYDQRGYSQSRYDPYYGGHSSEDWPSNDRSGVYYGSTRDGELIGGTDYDPYYDRSAPHYDHRAPVSQPRQGRVYTASSGCRWMNAGASGQMYMCQGSDGIWRPADQY